MEQDHLEILLEDINGKFDLVLEGHQVLRNDIQRVREESQERDDHLLFLIQTLNTKIDGVETRLSACLDGVETRLDGVETRLDRVETKVDGVAADLAAHRRDTEAHGGVYCVRE